MSDLKVIYEFITNLDYIFIKKYLKERVPVFVVEPFHAYHDNEEIRFFRPHLPGFIQESIRDGKVLVLKADQLNAKEIYSLAVEKAVDVVESVYPEYRKRFERIFSYVADTLKLPIAENAFRNNLCNRLADFIQ